MKITSHASHLTQEVLVTLLPISLVLSSFTRFAAFPLQYDVDIHTWYEYNSTMIRDWPLKVPATNGYPTIFGGRTLPYQPGIATYNMYPPFSGYPGTRKYFDNISTCVLVPVARCVEIRVEKDAYYCSNTIFTIRYQNEQVQKSFVFRFDTQAACSCIICVVYKTLVYSRHIIRGRDAP